MKSKLILAGLLLFSFSCSKDDDNEMEYRDVPESIQALFSTDCTCDPYINLYEWKDRLVYFWGIRGPACDGVPQYFDEKGNIIDLPEGISADVFLKEAELKKEVWRCDGD